MSIDYGSHDVTTSGNITGYSLISSQSSGGEGGELRLAKPATGSSLSGTSVTFDIYNNLFRIFETGSPNRGYFLNISEGDAGAGTSLRNKTLTYFTAIDNQPPASAFATLDTRNSIAVLDFDDTTQESAVFVGILPENSTLSSGILARVHWMATSATTGVCRWGVQFERMNTDLDSDSFDTATEAQSTTNITSGATTVTQLTCTSIDSVSAGDLFRIKLYRDVTDAADTMVGDAEVIAMEIRSVI